MSDPYPSPTSKPRGRGRGRGRGSSSYDGGRGRGNTSYRGNTGRPSFRSRGGTRGRGGRNVHQGDNLSSFSGTHQGNRPDRGRGGKSKFGGDGQRPAHSPLDDIIDTYLTENYKKTIDTGETMLELTNIAGSQYLIDNVRNFDPTRIYRKLCERIVQTLPEVNLLDLRNNNLDSLQNFSKLTELQHLTGICLSNNNFSTVADLQPLAGLQSLKQLYLNGNKCYSEGPSEQDVITLLQYFPCLDVIDGVLIPDTFKRRGSIIPPINIENVYLEINRDVVENFVVLFFGSLDDNKQALSTLFDEEGSVSLSIGDNMLLEPQYAPLHEKKRNLQPSNQAIDPQHLISTVFKTKIARDSAFKLLPKSKHNVDKRYLVVDCNVISPQNQTVVSHWMLTVHGHGTHFKPQGIKDSFSFTATFILKQETDRLLITNLIYQIRPYAGTSRDAFVDVCQQVIYTNQLDLAKQAKLREYVYRTRLKPEVVFNLFNLPEVAWTPSKFEPIFENYKKNGTINDSHML
nr:unnamed protein product [Naegleria fowleri]